MNKKELLYFPIFYHLQPQDVVISFKAVHWFPGGVVGVPKTKKSLAVHVEHTTMLGLQRPKVYNLIVMDFGLPWNLTCPGRQLL